MGPAAERGLLMAMPSNQSGPPAVAGEGLVKHYSSRAGTVEAVRGVDLEFRAGEIFGRSRRR
jgi:ABC-type glutathione transport system ATPase component